MKLTIDSTTLAKQMTPFGNRATWSIQLHDENDNVITVTTGERQETIDTAIELAASINTHPSNKKVEEVG